jgi:hypothetical protein
MADKEMIEEKIGEAIGLEKFSSGKNGGRIERKPGKANFSSHRKIKSDH